MELPVTGGWLYGSWARGTPHADSDIDVAVTLDPDPVDVLAALRIFPKDRG